ncbi:MAG TPA: phospholipid scramblase-related protein [Ilumatobacter sp.]|nr:phospholipid scramblase-related protein [Ilumatobacter sp.]
MSTHAPNWYPDPRGRHELRYFDGTAWTDHVSDNGITGDDPVDVAASPARSKLDSFESGLTFGKEVDPTKIVAQVSGDGRRGAGLTAPVAGGGGSILNEPVLVVNQKVKLIELNNQYSVFNQAGTQIAAVNQVGQSTAKKVARLVSSLDQFMTHELQVTDAAGHVVLHLTRPRKVMKSSVIVSDGTGREIGRIVQQNMFGKIRFGLFAGQQELGCIQAENWRAWNFRITDAAGIEVARITKTWEGFAKTMFTTADNYVVVIQQRPAEPLNTLVVASALCIDTALKQDSRGLG